MIDAPVRAVNDVIADFLARRPTDDEVLACHLPPDIQGRADFLAGLHGEDELMPNEKEELFEIVCANGFFSLLKAKIKRRQRLGKL